MKNFNFLFIFLLTAGSVSICSAQATDVVIHKATDENIFQNLTAVDDESYNGKENYYPIVTHNYNPGGGPGKHQSSNIGLAFLENQWVVYQEDLNAFSKNTSYNVLFPSLGTSSWKHTSDKDNVVGNFTIVDHPKINGDPDAIVLVSHMYNLSNGVGSYHNHRIGVFYYLAEQKWAIFNEDLKSMDEGVAFNIVIVGKASNLKSFVHVVDGDNIDGFTSVLKDASIDGNPNAKIVITNLYNPGGSVTGKYNNHPVGVYYNGSNWTITTENDQNMQPGTAFNVLIINEQTTYTNNEIMEIPSLRIGPNPVDQGGSFTIGLYNENHEGLTVELIDLNGRVVLSEDLAGQTVIVHRFSTEGLEPGVYLLSIKSDRLKAVRRIVIR